jgi:hypothetical protein
MKKKNYFLGSPILSLKLPFKNGLYLQAFVRMKRATWGNNFDKEC